MLTFACPIEKGLELSQPAVTQTSALLNGLPWIFGLLLFGASMYVGALVLGWIQRTSVSSKLNKLNTVS